MARGRATRSPTAPARRRVRHLVAWPEPAEPRGDHTVERVRFFTRSGRLAGEVTLARYATHDELAFIRTEASGRGYLEAMMRWVLAHARTPLIADFVNRRAREVFARHYTGLVIERPRTSAPRPHFVDLDDTPRP